MSKCTAPELNGNNQSKETTQLKEINKLLTKYQEQSVTTSESQKEQIREKGDSPDRGEKCHRACSGRERNKKGRAASTTALPRFHYKLYLTKLKPHPYILTNP
ncbi:MAG: hypothetical protein K2J78_07620 [Muribaculaceae bacterium]|nr:hypothetical protein [Muribaculaceae bacterium]